MPLGVTVMVLVAPATTVGVKEIWVRLGRPATDRVTGPVNKAARVIETVTPACEPWAMVTEAGRLSEAGTTVRPNGAARSPGAGDGGVAARTEGTPDAVPLMLRLVRPGTTDPATVTVMTDVVPVGAAGTNVAVTPAGGLSSARVTGPVKLVRVRVTVAVPWPPWMISAAAGAIAIV